MITLLTLTCKSKNSRITRYFVYFHLLGERKNINIELWVTRIKLKRHKNINVKLRLKLANSFYQVMNDTEKQRYYLIFIFSEFQKRGGLSITSEVKINSILAFKICILHSLEYSKLLEVSLLQ